MINVFDCVWQQHYLFRIVKNWKRRIHNTLFKLQIFPFSTFQNTVILRTKSDCETVQNDSKDNKTHFG